MKSGALGNERLARSESAWQSSAKAIDGTEWDVAVVGAGPAGAVAGLTLAQHGHRVAVLDSRCFPREKTCGDGLLPDALAVLDELGLAEAVADAAHRVDEAEIHSPGGVVNSLPGRFLTLKREALDDILFHAASSAGATAVAGTVAEVCPDAAGAWLRTKCGARLRASIVILATGARVELAKGLGKWSPPAVTAVAARMHVRSNATIRRMVFSYDRAILPGYGWIFPLGNGEYNIGCGLFGCSRTGDGDDVRALFARFTRSFAPASRLMEQASSATRLRGAPLHCGLSRWKSDPFPHILGVGETIGTTFPFSGEGIGKAMLSGLLAANAAHSALAGRDNGALLGLYERLRSELQPKYRAYHVAQNWVARPWLCDLLARRTQRSAYLRHAISGVFHETVDPSVILSWRGMLRSLVS